MINNKKKYLIFVLFIQFVFTIFLTLEVKGQGEQGRRSQNMQAIGVLTGDRKSVV